MAKEYSLARVTVRQAVQLLVNDKLLSSQRGRRTYVTYKPRAPNPKPLFLSVDFMSSVTAEYAIQVLSHDEVSADYLDAAFMGRPDGRYMRVRKIDFESGTPYSTSTHFIVKGIHDRFPAESDRHMKIARLIRDYGGSAIKECRERISVVAVDHEQAGLLKCPVAAPAGKVVRVFTDAKGFVLYLGVLFFRNDRFGIERDVTSLILA
jgi:GntR family transcriptional regulator